MAAASEVRQFAFNRWRLLAMVAGLSLLSIGLVVIPPSGSTMLHRLSGSIAGTVMLYSLGGLLLAVALFHLPNLVRSFLGLPAVVLDGDHLHLYHFPSKTISMRDLTNVELELGSLRLTFRSGARKWVNLKIVEDGQQCADAIAANVLPEDGTAGARR